MINKIISILSDNDNQLDAIALVPGSNFQYLTGGQFFFNGETSYSYYFKRYINQ